MQITTDVPAQWIADLFITAIESGDPVTTGFKGGWCDGIFWQSRNETPPKTTEDPWYAAPALYERSDFKLEIVEIDDETTGHKTSHFIGADELQLGLRTMAAKFPHLFSQIIKEEIDSDCADIFLQCVCFGEEKYA